MCGFWPSSFIGSFQIVESRGLLSVSRPLVPNTATASVSALMVERCTSSSALLRLLSLSCAVMSSKT